MASSVFIRLKNGRRISLLHNTKNDIAEIAKASFEELVKRGQSAPVKVGVKQGVQVPYIERSSELR